MAMQFILVRYDVDADVEPIYSSRLEVGKFASEGTANHVARNLQRELPGTVRGMFCVERQVKPGQFRCTYSAR